MNQEGCGVPGVNRDTEGEGDKQINGLQWINGVFFSWAQHIDERLAGSKGRGIKLAATLLHFCSAQKVNTAQPHYV